MKRTVVGAAGARKGKLVVRKKKLDENINCEEDAQIIVDFLWKKIPWKTLEIVRDELDARFGNDSF